MIQVDLTHMRHFIALPYEAALAPRLRIAHNHLQKSDGPGGEFTGWVRLPQEYDREEFARIQAAARRIQSDSQALVVIGIGGSYLGARGVIECLCSPNYNLKKKNTPNIYFIGNGLSSEALTEAMELVEGVDFSVNVISKSGTTTEPAVAFRFFRELLGAGTILSGYVNGVNGIAVPFFNSNPMVMMILPAGGFLMMGFILAAIQKIMSGKEDK